MVREEEKEELEEEHGSVGISTSCGHGVVLCPDKNLF